MPDGDIINSKINGGYRHICQCINVLVSPEIVRVRTGVFASCIIALSIQ
jgi:hypothetical protein